MAETMQPTLNPKPTHEGPRLVHEFLEYRGPNITDIMVPYSFGFKV